MCRNPASRSGCSTRTVTGTWGGVKRVNYGQEWFEVGTSISVAEVLASRGFEVKADTDPISRKRSFYARVAR